MKKNKNPLPDAEFHAADMEEIIKIGKQYDLADVIWLLADLNREGIKALTLWQILTMIRINNNIQETK